MMYARPETDPALARYWDLIRKELKARGIPSPERLAQDAEEFSVWRDPDLVLSQTCGMPYRLFLHGDVSLIGTPDFALPDCPPGYYQSVFVVRHDDPRATLDAFQFARFAFNMPISQSGWAGPYNHIAPRGWWFEDQIQSHGHLNSARMVADGTADIAALDGVTWDLIRRYETFAAKLRVLEATEPTPGLPYIAGPDADAEACFAAVSDAIAGLTEDDRRTLGLSGLVKIPAEVYLAIPNPPESALNLAADEATATGLL